MPDAKQAPEVWSETQLRELARRALAAVTGVNPGETEVDEVVRRELQEFAGAVHPGGAPEIEAGRLRDGEAAVKFAADHGVASVPEALAWGSSHASCVNPAATAAECAQGFLAASTKHGRVPSTLSVYRLRLAPFLAEFGERRVRSLEVDEIARYLAHWHRENTRRAHWTTLNGFFIWMVRAGHSDRNLVRLAMARPKPEFSAGVIYTPYEVMRVLHETMFTDQIGFWVLSLYAGLRIREIWGLQKHPDPWSLIDLPRRELTLDEQVSSRGKRVVIIPPVLRAWFRWMQERKLPFFPSAHWTKYPLMQAIALGGRALSRLGRRRRAAPAQLRAVNVARRTYLAYRMAITGADLARTSDECSQTERTMRTNYANKVSHQDAVRFFAMTPSRVRAAGRAVKKEKLQIQLKFNPGPAYRSKMATRPPPVQTAEESAKNWVLPGGRPGPRARFEEGMVRFFVEAAELMGVPKSVAAVYGIVFATPEPLSFSEISERLDFSGGSVSQGLKALRELGAIRVAGPAAEGPEGGHKAGAGRGRERFEPDTEMRRLIQRFIEQRLETQLRRGQTRLTALQAAATAYGAQDRKMMEQRLLKLRHWHDRTRALMPMIKMFLQLTKA